MIDRSVAERLQCSDGATGNFVDIGEIPLLKAISVQDDRSVLADPLSEAKWTHIGTTCWSVNRKAAKNGDVQAVQMVVAITDRLSGFLGSRIRRKGRIGHRFLMKWNRIVTAVEAGTGSENKLVDAAVPTVFKHIQRARHIRCHVSPGVVDALTNTGACGQMDHCAGRCVGRHSELEFTPIGNIEFAKRKTGLREQPREPP